MFEMIHSRSSQTAVTDRRRTKRMEPVAMAEQDRGSLGASHPFPNKLPEYATDPPFVN
jgi:hypothetical protein